MTEEIIKINGLDYKIIYEGSLTEEQRLSVSQQIMQQFSIKSLALSNPNIIDYTAYWDGTNTYALLLWTNSGGNGYVGIVVYDQGGFWKGQIESCMDARVGLKYLTRIFISGPTTTFLEIHIFRCGSDTAQQCSPTASCLAPIRTGNTGPNVGVRARDTTAPAAPTGLAAVAGNGQLTVSWNPVTNTPIFAYFLSITDVSTGSIVDFGYLESNITSWLFANLTNGKAYDINVLAVNHSYVNGAISTIRGTPKAPTLATITISPTPVSVNVGQTQQFTAVCKDDGNVMTCPTLTWTSSNTSVATISGTGLLTGVTSGTTNVTAKSGTITSNTAAVTVTPATIEISPTTATVNVGQTQQFTAVCKNQNNNPITCPILTWESSDPTKATITQAGLLTGVLAGTTNVTAKYITKTSNITGVTVTTPTPTLNTIQLSPPSITLSPGSIQTFIETCKDQFGNVMTCPTMTWTSSNESVGTITPVGVFTAIAGGTTTVRATSGIVEGTAFITVSAEAPVLTSIMVSPSTASIAPGSTKTFTGTPKDQFGNVMTGIAITWSVVDTIIGTVNPATGLTTTFTGATEGTTTIRATSGTVVGTAYVTVTTAAPPAAGAGMAIAVVAALALGYFILRPRPPAP